jgi:hypothetical protein
MSDPMIAACMTAQEERTDTQWVYIVEHKQGSIVMNSLSYIVTGSCALSVMIRYVLVHCQ